MVDFFSIISIIRLRSPNINNAIIIFTPEKIIYDASGWDELYLILRKVIYEYNCLQKSGISSTKITPAITIRDIVNIALPDRLIEILFFVQMKNHVHQDADPTLITL